MSNTLRFVLAVLACYRLTGLLAHDWEVGPYEILHKIRKAAGSGELGKALACPFCLGVWLSVPFGLLVQFPSVIGDFFLLILAVAGGQALLEHQGSEVVE